jgi:hypothetical protein
MRHFRVVAALTVLAGGALAACSEAPACQYLPHPQSPEIHVIGKAADPSQQPMLPYNPYWVARDASLPVIGSTENPCAGEPGYPGRLPP